MKNKAESN